MARLSDRQLEIVQRPAEGRAFLEGPAGTGKTTAGVARLLHLLRTGIPGRSILLLVPQRTIAAPYYAALRRPTVEAGGEVTILTLGGLARRMVDLFWPLVAGEAGFAHPNRPPVFLTLETAQYHLARAIRPLLDKGYLNMVVVARPRLYSQILDNLNKAALVGFPHTEIGQRLAESWGGEKSRLQVYQEVQECTERFRAHCLAHNLLDFSLQMEVFLRYLWPLPLCREYLLETYTHLIADNVEEDTPAAHDLIGEWLPHTRSALLIYDHDAGYRRFLGADPEGGYALRSICSEQLVFDTSFVTSPHLRRLEGLMEASLLGRRPAVAGDTGPALVYESHRYYPQMLDWVADQVSILVTKENVPPGEIVILAPFLGDSVRFALTSRLEERGVPARSHRPSRALREEPAARALLTLALLAHPHWEVSPSPFDVAYALMEGIEGLDLVRAQWLTGVVYRQQDGRPALSSFEQFRSEARERLTPELGERYERLRLWLEKYASGPPAPLDHFLSRLFGEVLSQPGYGFHRAADRGEVAANLIESARKFRQAVPGTETGLLGQWYIGMVEEGIVAAQYVREWRPRKEDAVLLAPAYTFLLRNRPVEVQFWLDVGASGWWERLYQPLTHPYVLSRSWTRGRVWTDGDEFETRQETLYRLVVGLLRRCRKRVYLGLCQLGENGSEQRGPLLYAVQRVLRWSGG